ncbi:hypothetical protein [Vibrio diabolicus]|uniref:hypothetical protein n=1 Tax=Vibrio diabolicus TaxID=50719 RepID=UPI00217547D7|nr:hypothetical protein [Vibrio diabolicus]
MPIQRRVKNNRITHEQVAKLILLCSKTHESEAEQYQKRFTLREELIHQILGMPLSHDDRFSIIRELNMLGWQVAITPDSWLVFVIDEEELFKWDEARFPYEFLGESLQAIQHGQEPLLGELDNYYGLNSNSTAKFYGWSDEDIQEQLVEEALDDATEEIQEEYANSSDKSLLDIKEGDQIGLTNFTSWNYIEHKLVEKGLVFKRK